jgi:DNA replication protein DnaC
MKNDPLPIRGVLGERLDELRRRLQSHPGQSALAERDPSARERELAADLRSARLTALEAAGVPRKVLGALDEPEERAAIRFVREWLAGGKTFLFLAGDVDTGKTFAAAFALSEWLRRAQQAAREIDREVARAMAEKGVEAAVHAFCAHERPARGVPLFRKARQIATMSQFDEEGWRMLYRAPLLVVDDLGTEPLDEKGWGEAAILDLIDRRYDDERRTILTTNLSWESFLARYAQDGGRLRRRLREAADWVDLTA